MPSLDVAAPAVDDGVVGRVDGHHLVTCTYQTKLAGQCRYITISWARNGMSITVDGDVTCKVQMKPWLFWRKLGSKMMDVDGSHVEIVWDLSSVRMGSSGPEPVSGFYVAVVSGGEVALLLGDKAEVALRRCKGAHLAPIEATLVSRREHVFGRRRFAARAPLEEGGPVHDITIECQTDPGTLEPCLDVHIDRHPVLQIRHLTWKFRGNQTVSIAGAPPLEIYWDLHNWIFQSPSSTAHATFIFHTRQISSELMELNNGARLKKPRPVSGNLITSTPKLLPAGARSLRNTKDNQTGISTGFSLLLYAWKSD